MGQAVHGVKGRGEPTLLEEVPMPHVSPRLHLLRFAPPPCGHVTAHTRLQGVAVGTLCVRSKVVVASVIGGGTHAVLLRLDPGV